MLSSTRRSSSSSGSATRHGLARQHRVAGRRARRSHRASWVPEWLGASRRLGESTRWIYITDGDFAAAELLTIAPIVQRGPSTPASLTFEAGLGDRGRGQPRTTPTMPAGDIDATFPSHRLRCEFQVGLIHEQFRKRASDGGTAALLERRHHLVDRVRQPLRHHLLGLARGGTGRRAHPARRGA